MPSDEVIDKVIKLIDHQMEVDSRVEVPLQSISLNKPARESQGQAGGAPGQSLAAVAKNNRLKSLD